LLFAIGVKGGFYLSNEELSAATLSILGLAILFSVLCPLVSFIVLRRLIDSQNAAAMAASLGSVSAVTFVTAIHFLESRGTSYSGVLVAVMAIMESPAIVVGILLAKASGGGSGRYSLRKILHEALTGGAVFLLLAALFIGAISGDKGWETLKPFASGLFPGVLCFFLLDMGQTAASRLRECKQAGLALFVAGLVLPIAFGLASMITSFWLDLSEGDALLFAILCGSASYIAVPAAVRVSIPKANPSIYVPMALGITFPFNVILGIPMYAAIIERLW
jgi:hypothetical protein